MAARDGYHSNWQNLMDAIGICKQCVSLMDSDNPEPVRSRITEAVREIREREQSSEPYLTLPALREALALEGCGWFCVVLALCCELDGGLRNSVQSLTGTPVPNFDFACGVYSQFSSEGRIDEGLNAADAEHSALRYLFCLEKGSDAVQPLLFTPLLPRRNVLRFLLNGNVQHGRNRRLFQDHADDFLPVRNELLESAENALRKMMRGENILLYVTGRAGSGKRILARRAAARTERPCLFYQCGGEPDEAELFARSCECALDAVLSNSVLCVCGYGPDCAKEAQALFRQLPDRGIPCLILSDREDCPAPEIEGKTVLHLTTGFLNGKDYETAQSYFCGKYGIEPSEAPDYFRMTFRQIETAWLAAEEHCRREGRGKIGGGDFAFAVRAQEKEISGALNVESGAKMDDLIVTDETRNRLELLCGCIESNREAEKRGDSGENRGVIGLLYGPSGTGKTMAASAIANKLGLELLKIDLSRVLDKYIGETEKRLAEIFEAAKERSCILFFDEADALFSRRTEVSSSNDRYANVETSYLLQSIEQYGGTVLLATNLFKNFDEAFLRRITVLARFSMPDEAQRLLLWKQAFPGDCSDLDLKTYARELELSPATIHAAARLARMAAKARGGRVTDELMTEALRNEAEKEGKTGPANDSLLFQVL
ncbi:ATP-binding protein [Caproicibacter sp.]|uniref:ATP-binding protein n=1 Tax=Caproicibacter sp. TaxID=2814884 RepID=UPI003989BD7D